MCLLAVTTATKIYLAHDLAVFMQLAPGHAGFVVLASVAAVCCLNWFRLCLSCIDTVLYNIFNVCFTVSTTALPACVMLHYCHQACVIGFVMDLPVTLPLFFLWGHSVDQ